MVEPPSVEEIEPPKETKLPKKRGTKKDKAAKKVDTVIDDKENENVLNELLADYEKTKTVEIANVPKKRAYTKKADKIENKLIEEPVAEQKVYQTRRIRKNIRARRN